MIDWTTLPQSGGRNVLSLPYRTRKIHFWVVPSPVVPTLSSSFPSILFLTSTSSPSSPVYRFIPATTPTFASSGSHRQCLAQVPPSTSPASAMELEPAILPTNSNGTCRSSIALRYRAQDASLVPPVFANHSSVKPRNVDVGVILFSNET